MSGLESVTPEEFLRRRYGTTIDVVRIASTELGKETGFNGIQITPAAVSGNELIGSQKEAALDCPYKLLLIEAVIK